MIKKYKLDIIEILLITYAILILLSTLNSKYVYGSIFGISNGRGEGIITLYGYLLCFYISYKIYRKSELAQNLTTISVVIVSCIGILQALLGLFNERFLGYGIGTMRNPNFYSSFLTMLLPMYIITWFNKKDNYYLYVIGIVFSGLVSSTTLSGYITFGIYILAIILYFGITSKDKKYLTKQIIIVTILFISIFVTLNAANDNKYFAELNLISSEIENASNNSGKFGNLRGYIWIMCKEILLDYPIFGVGPDSLGSICANYYMPKDDYYFKNTLIDKAHNEYLHIAVTTGIPSLIVYLGILMVILFKLFSKFLYYVKNKKLDSDNCIFLVMITASILSYLVQAFVNISVTCVAPMFWCVLGIGYNIATKKEE